MKDKVYETNLNSTIEYPGKEITRLEVVDEPIGRVYSKWDTELEFSIQDDGRTLKIFVKDRKPTKVKLSDLGITLRKLKK